MKYYLTVPVLLAVSIQTVLCFNADFSYPDYENDQSDGDGLVTEEYIKNFRRLVGNLDKRHEEVLLSCIRRCRKGTDPDVVCGSDNNNYANVGQLYCAAVCGRTIRVVQLSECPKETSTKPQLTSEEINTCISRCPSDDPYGSPVCGTNNVTYENRRKLGCAFICGIDVSLQKATAC